MNSKTRVLKALNREVPDRVAIDFLTNPGLRKRLADHFGLDENDRVGLKRALQVDFMEVAAPYRGPRLHPEPEDPNRRVNPEWGFVTQYIEHASGAYWDFCDFPLQNTDEEVFAKWPLPSPDDYDCDEAVRQAEALSEFAVYYGNPGLGDIMNTTGFLCGMERAYMDLFTEEPALLDFVDRRLAVQLELMERVLDKGRGKIDFIWMGEDLGTQIAPIISLDMFRRVIKPRHQKFIDLAKAYNLPVMLHSCGSSSWSYDDYIEMGLDAIDTLQPEAKDMDPAYLKERWGDKLAFHGCISTAGPVAYGTPEEVISYCRKTLEIMMPGGGYCFSPTHELQDNSPTENVLAMYETALKFGSYG